ncbi:MAG: tetratricopeptide repeat protein [Cyclobacteriaceae bacterium]|nr:tetratricopeptide repeat protein [Cyclobacteriaceae bacterium]
MLRLVLFAGLLLFTAGFLSCTPETWTGRVFHNTTAHYNGYFYAREEINRIEKIIRLNHQDDYNQILWLFPRLDSLKAKAYDKDIQEAIKMASISIQRHPGSKWLDDAYLLVGKARLYSFDWGNAIQTFKYVNNDKVTKDVNMRHAALIWLLRTYTEHKEYNNAEAVIAYLLKERLNRSNRKSFLLNKAYYYQVRNNYDGMIRALTEAEPLLTRKDRPGRIYFIMGQVYQHLGFESEAYNFYREAISTHPEYEVDFYARLYMAQVAEISRSRDVAHARKSFKKLLTDSKNRDFKDKIYYEMGVFEEKQGNLTEAIGYYNKALRIGNNNLVKGDAYFRLGHVYYDSLRNFEMAQAYYDSAVRTMPPSRPGYAGIKQRQEVLNEFVKHYKNIKWNDSLLTLSKMDTATIRKLVVDKISSSEKPVSVKRKREQRVNTNTSDAVVQQEVSATASGWYFSNQSTLATGRVEFVRVWGKFPLEDNWRRSARTVISTDQSVASAPSDTESKPEAPSTTDKATEAFKGLLGQIPYSPQQKAEALKKIETSLFALGDIYYFKLGETKNAVLTYQTLLKRFPDSEYEPEVLYKLFLILKQTDEVTAQNYALQLNQKHPESTFNKLIQNPNYLAENEQTQNKQKLLYQQAYFHFQNNHLTEARRFLEEARGMEETPFTPYLLMLDILITAKAGDKETYAARLEDFIRQNENAELVELAKSLQEALKASNKNKEPDKPVYTRQIEEPHYFVFSFDPSENLESPVTAFLNDFNRTNFRDLQLKVSRTELNGSQVLILVSDLPRVSTAIEYYRLIAAKLAALADLKNRKFNTFVISKGNFNTLYRTQKLHEYLEFFTKVYRTDSP